MPFLHLQGVSKVYVTEDAAHVKSEFLALNQVSLDIEEGEYVAIVGPSGSGKSTLLQILGLLDTPSSGDYRIHGQSVKDMSDDALTDLRAKTMGFVFQSYNLLSRMSVFENVRLPLIYQGRAIRANDILETLDMVDLRSRAFHRPTQLSGGQQQRAAIARALVTRPKLILADEPTGNLPQKQAVEIIEELEKLHAAGITLIVITHSQELAQRAKRIVRIVDGCITEDTRTPQGHEETGPSSSLTAQRQPAASPVSARPTLNSGATAAPRTSLINLSLSLETFKMAWQSIMKNKVRSFLTMLGVIIGVFSVISMMALGKAAKKSVEVELRKIGSNLVRVKSAWPKIKGSASHKRTITRLDERDLEALNAHMKHNPMLKNVAATSEGSAVVTFEGYSYSTKVMGVSPSFKVMRDNTPELGRFFSEGENENLERVVVLGKTVYENLFKSKDNPIGKQVWIEDRSYRVIGLLPSKGSNWGEDIDDIILMPVETARKRLFGRKHYNFIFVQSEKEEHLQPVMEQVSQILRKNHRIAEGAGDDFELKNYGEMRETISNVSDNIVKLIALIALISLVVGGIGIMNIMLVSVIERTREIGIRKAIGAKRRDILSQFLIESSFLSGLGGLVGIAGAITLSAILERTIYWDITVDPEIVLVAFLFSLSVGVFFGMYPALKASKLSPISALRYD